MTKNSDCKKFYVIGLNYKKADVVTRSNFSLSKENQKLLLAEAKRININTKVDEIEAVIPNNPSSVKYIL